MTAAADDRILARHHATLDIEGGRFVLSYHLRLPDGRVTMIPVRIPLHSKRREVALETAAALLAGAPTAPAPGPFSIQ